jgi:hypothetical protein
MTSALLPILAAVLALTGCVPAHPPGFPPSGYMAAATIPAYDRKLFGTHWKLIRGHCDVREIDLERAAVPPAADADGDGCRDDGKIRDAYTGTIIPPSQAQIDHIYPLKAAWLAGAYRWAPAQRHALYNDLDNTIAVTGTLNESKGERTIGQWRPPARAEWCDYAQRYRHVATTYQLSLSTADTSAISEMENTCNTK